ncbi:DUF6153 family protein [Streptomyces sp. NPDC006529]|uniref:DUF6153 family protein n=1 Tax=Streptomyces sp. NPDC006529 TaxID=3157177 RepID=UPI0033BEC6F4
MTDAARRTPRAARWSRVLLLAALLLGIVTMHTLGHPDDSRAGRDAPPAHSGAHAMPAPPADAPAAAPAPEGDAAARGQLLGDPADGRMAMDPMSVCLAVLLTGITLLGALALARAAVGSGPAARRGVRGGRVRGGPDPPGGRELLTLLAVLRV